MAYVTTDDRLGIVPALFAAGSAGYKYRGALSRLFGGSLLANRSTVERWYNSMPAWAKQVLTVDDLMSSESESRGAGSIVDYAKRMDRQPMVRGGWTQADMTRYENAIAENLRVASGSGQHDWHILLAALQTAVVNIALYGNPLGPGTPETPSRPGLPPPTRPGLPRGAQPEEITPPSRRPPAEKTPKVQEAGFGGLPTWAMVLLAAGIGIPVIIGIAKGKR